MTLKLYNTLGRKVEEFKPLRDTGKVTLYTCGPTVYNYLHVGNWAAYIYWDTLVRILMADGYAPERVMNITDVGHLTSDEDEGEDKMQKGATREGKTAWEIAEFYSEDFLQGMDKLGLILPEHIIKATDYIPQQLDLIRTLKEKGYTYQISDGIYFDTAKFSRYADFAHLDLAALKAGARVEQNPEKRNPSDFALWKFSPKNEKRDMEWETPADVLESEKLAETADGKTDLPANSIMGFPGWHLECSAIAMSLLGPTIDIHTGGIDHIPVHHTNEIAQSEAATGRKFADYWLHCNHLKSGGTKISKSLGNGYTLQDLAEKGFAPLDYRMFVLQGQYQGEGNFSFENLQSAKNRLQHWREIAAFRWQTGEAPLENSEPSLAIIEALKNAVNDNLNTPEALRLVDELFSKIEKLPTSSLNTQSFNEILEVIDDLLGLQLRDHTPDIDTEVKKLLTDRASARQNKDWQTSDRLRDELDALGIGINDTPNGATWFYKN